MQDQKDKTIKAVDHINQAQNNRPKGTVVGTEDYSAPEVLAAEVSGPPADLWSFGVIVYMMLTGSTPFKGHTQYITFKNIAEGKYAFPVNDPNFPEEARDFVQKLLKKEPSERLGAGYEGSDNDYHALKNHPFFDGINFEKIFLLPSPIEIKKFKRSTIMQKFFEQK